MSKFIRDHMAEKMFDKNGNLTQAIFLPALSTFYSSYIGRQRFDPNAVPQSRIPSDFEHGIEGMNWLNKDKGYFTYKWTLYSAGHAELDVTKHVPKEDMIRNRDRKNTFLLGDSGGFQIGKGIWPANWKDPSCPEASKKRKAVLSWMDAYMDYGMILDVPPWAYKSERGRINSGINTHQDAIIATHINNEYFMRNRSGSCKFLNVLQGTNYKEANEWYEEMKKYCDPKQYEQPFNGWAMSGQNKCSVSLMLRRLITLREDGLLEEGLHDYMHFLGTSKLEWALVFTDVQRAVRKYHNPNFTITFDCASPFLATATGQVYTNNEFADRKKWTYRMQRLVDDKKYAFDSRYLMDVIRDDHIYPLFESSPIIERCKINDICYYKPGELNKIGKEGKTSWDSFSYALQMGHNVHRHIDAVQTANLLYDQGRYPAMLISENFDRITFRDLVNELFSISEFGKAMEFIEHHDRFWTQIIGANIGATGKKEINAMTMFNQLFEEVSTTSNSTVSEVHDDAMDESGNYHVDDSGLDDSALDQLESEIE